MYISMTDLSAKQNLVMELPPRVTDPSHSGLTNPDHSNKASQHSRP